jgi:hypothetical protein
MAKKSTRSVSRKMKRTMKRKNRDRRTRRNHHHRRNRSYGGEAPVNYHLSGSWPSRMSLGQGADYFKYHQGQHGGALAMGPFPGAVVSSGLPQDLRGPAHIGGLDNAIADVRGLCDPPNCPTTTVGGKRKSKSRRHKKNKTRKNKTRKNKRNRRYRKKTGGSLGFAPFPSEGMLLDSSTAYAQAGLNPEWKTDVAFTDAKIRDTQ